MVNTKRHAKARRSLPVHPLILPITKKREQNYFRESDTGDETWYHMLSSSTIT